MKVALGQSESEEYLVGLAEVAETLKGNVGLLFTKLGREEVGSCRHTQYFTGGVFSIRQA